MKAELEKKLCDLDKEEEEKEEPVPAATTTESGTAATCMYTVV